MSENKIRETQEGFDVKYEARRRSPKANPKANPKAKPDGSPKAKPKEHAMRSKVTEIKRNITEFVNIRTVLGLVGELVVALALREARPRAFK